MNQKIEICYAIEDDVPDIMSIMDIACQLARDASWYSADDENYVRKHLHENGFILKAKADGCMDGFLIVRFPKDAGDNLERAEAVCGTHGVRCSKPGLPGK